jgi:predicted GNAT family acetyltransferase
MVSEAVKKTMDMRIQHEESEIRGRHFLNDEAGNMLAELTYAVDHPDTMVIDHTEVTEELRGQHIGDELVQAAVEHARAKGRNIVPVCPFAKKLIERNPEWKELVRS